MKFAAYKACKNCKFSDKIYYNYDNDFFHIDYFYWRTLYIRSYMLEASVVGLLG